MRPGTCILCLGTYILRVLCLGIPKAERCVPWIFVTIWAPRFFRMSRFLLDSHAILQQKNGTYEKNGGNGEFQKNMISEKSGTCKKNGGTWMVWKIMTFGTERDIWKNRGYRGAPEIRKIMISGKSRTSENFGCTRKSQKTMICGRIGTCENFSCKFVVSARHSQSHNCGICSHKLRHS